MARLEFEVITLFPELIEAVTSVGLLGKAARADVVQVRCTNPRDFAEDRHRTVDDAPFGGGPGMVMRAEPVVLALEHAAARGGPMHRVLLAPSGRRFDQREAERLASFDRIAFVCGRYEGIDDRVREHFVDEVLSLGDFVLNGGEIAALAMIEAIGRLREGFVGNPGSTVEESFRAASGGQLLEHPQYTRPDVFRGHPVPEVLRSGDHRAIAAWRTDAALARTWSIRPDLRREAPSLPVDAGVYVAVSAAMSPLPDLVEVLRRHEVMGLVTVGGDATQAEAWVRALQGRVTVAGFEDLLVLRRRLRRRHRGGVWIVALVEEGRAGVASLPEALDAGLAAAADPAAMAVVLMLPLGTADAAPLPGVDRCARGPETRLADGPAIRQPSPPQPGRHLDLLEAALCGMGRRPPHHDDATR